jgi:hypothetical protein
MEIEKHLIEDAADAANLDHEVRWNAANQIRGVHSRDCFAIVGNDSDFARFFGMLLRGIAEDAGEFPDEYTIRELADSVAADSMAKDTIYGFAGIKVIDGAD